MKRPLAIALLGLVLVAHAEIGGQSTFRLDPILLTGEPAPGVEPALVDEIGVYVDIFNPDPFAGGPQIGRVGVSASVRRSAETAGHQLPAPPCRARRPGHRPATRLSRAVFPSAHGGARIGILHSGRFRSLGSSKEVRMPCPLAPRRLLALGCVFALAATFALSGCEAVSGDDEATAPFGVTVSQLYLTVENRTGTALIDGRVEIIPAGRAVVFTTAWPRMEIGDRRDFMLNVFRGTDGTPFRRGVVRARRVKVTARDLAGTLYEREVPFD